MDGTKPLWRLLVGASLLLLVACATAPSSAPSGVFARNLSLCAGDVTNAPDADSRRRIDDYAAFADVRGIILARAPAIGCLSSGYGPRTRGQPGGPSGFHNGVDISTGGPAMVRAAGSGRVVRAEFAGAFGNLVQIRHGRGVETFYAHLSRIDVRTGDRVAAGDPVGVSGRTGNATGVHLHYEIRVDGQAVNPLTVTR